MGSIQFNRAPFGSDSGGGLPLRAECAPISSMGVSALLPKGGSAVALPDSVLVLDTGQPELPAPELRNPRSQEELDTLYRDTIRRGIVDHHGIDATVVVPVGVVRRSTTGMIALAPDLVLEQIDQRSVSEITAHKDSDLDSLAACYLAQSLREQRVLPTFAPALAEHVDRVDFGLYRVEPERYVASLAGVVGALKRVHDEAARAEVGPIFGDGALSREEKSQRAAEVFERHQRQIIEESFAVFQGCENGSRMGALDLDDISPVVAGLPGELKEKIERGQEATSRDLEIFEREHGAALRGRGFVVGKDGERRAVPVVIFEQTDLNPLLVMNLCYLKEAPETVVAVYAGPSRKGGDAYDIGIKSETAQGSFTLESVAVVLSAVEGELRKPLLAKLRAKSEAGTISPEELKKLEVLTTPRKGFEHLQIGDPTVCVAGGSLVAASTNSLMSREEFVASVKEALGM